MSLTTEAQDVVRRLAEGWTLKSHRHLDGRKECLLHPLGAASAQPVPMETVRQLQQHRLIDSNMKFPAATYLLTERGRAMAAQLGAGNADEGPLTSRNWS
ncbi:MAG: hypothetical protein RRC07_08290 [Anaerolineae bacterium]|nr:hypothetical protein [Anaerolineae bacterium]